VSREDGRLIHLSNRREGDFVIVEFQDSGGGIPQKLLARVFEPYLTTKGDTAGTGLGLYLCRQIAENLDEGEVWAENRKFEFDGKPYYGACICLKFKPIGGENSREY
jgi:signal transduction histidine kinase